MTKMIQVNLETGNIDMDEAQAWVDEITNVYADMKVSGINISGNKVSFQTGFSGMDDTVSEDIKQKIDEYITMTETLRIKSISCV